MLTLSGQVNKVRCKIQGNRDSMPDIFLDVVDVDVYFTCCVVCFQLYLSPTRICFSLGEIELQRMESFLLQ